jgi:Spy/CpxP family protein refolding chaperone
MKTKLLIIALSLTFSSLILACPDGKQACGKHKGERKNKLASALNLSEEQRPKFDAVMVKKHESIKAAMQVIHEDTKAQLAQFLTAEQIQTLDERKKKHRSMKLHREY